MSWRCTFASRVLVVLMACAATSAGASSVSPAAEQIIRRIDALDVEHHWPAGVHVSWRSGNPDGKTESGFGKHTHCSAFAAAAAEVLGIYLLRPPEHSQVLLANAQYDWLENEGVAQGWRPVRDEIEAQALANQGELVLATYKNRRDDKPGHIAIVRPSTKSDASIRREGPDVTQAGGTNYRSTSLADGFAGHPSAWGRHEVRFYAHVVKDPRKP
jgi:hypothetical protein